MLLLSPQKASDITNILCDFRNTTLASGSSTISKAYGMTAKASALWTPRNTPGAFWNSCQRSLCELNITDMLSLGHTDATQSVLQIVGTTSM